MPRGSNTTDANLLRAALDGLEAQKARIEQQIKDVQGMLGRRRGRPAAAAVAAAPARRKRRLSAAARKRIAAAQKRRWAEYRKKAQKAAKG
jgi:hypothetical protein